MKQQIIYIHGGDSFSQPEDFMAHLRTVPLRDLPSTTDRPPRWTDRLAEELGAGYEVYMPSMPNKHNARYEEWVIWFERYLALVNDGVILIGWSLGGMFLAKYLSEAVPQKRVRAAFILAAPGGEFLPPDGSGDDCARFRPDVHNVARLTAHVTCLEFWHSTDDPVVPVQEVDWYRAHVPEAKIVIFDDKNHFLVPELPELVSAIRDVS